MPLNQEQPPVPYWGLSRFYFFYYAAAGAIVPYWSLYLQESGFNAQAIGWLTALMAITRIVAPNLWGWLADRTQRRLFFIRWGAFLGLFFFLGLLVAREFYWVALVIVGFSFFWNAIISQFEAVTLAHLGVRRDQYSRIRLWGSVGFIAAVLLLGVLFDYINVIHLPKVIALLMLMIWISSMTIFEPRAETRRSERGGLAALLRQPDVMAFIAVAFLLQAAHAPYYVFFSIYLEEYGYSRAVIGVLWSLGVLAEIAVFWVMHRLMAWLSLRRVILVSLLLTTLRWLMIAYYADNVILLIVAQCLHAFSFGTLHASLIELVQRIFGSGHAGQGQAIYSSVSFGAGAALGAGLSGYLWESYGAIPTFTLAAAVCLFSLIVAAVWFRGERYC